MGRRIIRDTSNTRLFEVIKDESGLYVFDYIRGQRIVKNHYYSVSKKVVSMSKFKRSGICKSGIRKA